jgi:hypothetical protein
MGSARQAAACAAALVWGVWLTAAPAARPLADDDNPGVRNAHAFAYDGRVALLFGGASDRDVLGDTWGWDGKEWQRIAVPGPPPRTFPAFAGDGDSRVFVVGGSRVLFGDDSIPGSRDAAKRLLSDTWTWDGAHGAEVKGPQPPARAEAATAGG